MDALFYIIPESFNTQNVSIEQVVKALEAFLVDYGQMAEYKEENKIFILEGIFAMKLQDGLLLSDYVFTLDKVQGKEREIRRSLQRILMKLPQSHKSLDEIKSEINQNNQECCVGVISLVPIQGIADEEQIVYDKKSWFDFRRYHLGLFPVDSKYYIDECKKYYPNFFFHDKNYISIKAILNDFSQKIIYHLSALHDIYPSIKAEHSTANETELLTLLSNEASFDEKATLEGGSKNRLTFDFIDDREKEKVIVCESHIKLCRDNNNSNKYYSHRIYFHFGNPAIHNNKILIAHIGVHL